MARIALIHGAWCGAWCWPTLGAELERRGHELIAPDLPCEDPAAGARDYAQVIIDAAASVGDPDEPLVIAAHSVGGLTGPVLASMAPTKHVVYISSVLPDLGVSFADQFARGEKILTDDSGGRAADELERSYWVDEDRFRELCAADCEAATVHDWFEQLRPQARGPMREVCPFEQWPDAPHTYVRYTDDAIINADWVAQAVPERLGVQPLDLAGSHFGFEVAPAPLADVIDAAA